MLFHPSTSLYRPAAGGTWQNDYVKTISADEGGWGAYNIRTVIPAASLLVPGAASKIRITIPSLQAGHGTTTYGTIYVGERASSGNAYDFDGSQVQLLFGGSGTFSSVAAAGVDHISDDTVFTYTGAKDLVVAFHTNGSWLAHAADASITSYYQANATDTSASTTTSGLNTYAGHVYLSKIEVFA